MSRTIRRTKAKKHYSRFEKTYTHVRLEEWLDVEPSHTWRSNGMPEVPLEGKEFQRRYWHYHSDCGCHEFGFENAFERPFKESEGEYRARMRNQIVKWIKDHEYEVIDFKRKMIWDYC